MVKHLFMCLLWAYNPIYVAILLLVEHLDSSQFLSMMNKVAVYIPYKFLFGYMISFLWDK